MKRHEGWIMVFGALFLTGLFFFPLWNIQLGAPQYPDPLGLNIFINGIKGQSEFDVQNIDGLNHYIGMKTLPKPEDMWEFQWFPIIIMAMISLGILIGILYNLKKINAGWILAWLLLMSFLGALGIYDFNLWMTDYGTNLDPKAILKLQNPDGSPMSYKPPLLGHKKLLNFDAYSYPRLGAYFMLIGMVMVFIAYLKAHFKKQRTYGSPFVLIAIFMVFTSCSPKEEPFLYGKDECSYCKMGIVDMQHAAQIVTQKGKVFKYDAIECMLNDLKEKDGSDVALYRCNHFLTPKETVDAKRAIYLVSPNLRSPMGANLTAFPDTSRAIKAQLEYKGDLFNWVQLKHKFAVR